MNMLQCGKKFRLLIIFKERDEEVKVVFMVNRINTITILIIVFYCGLEKMIYVTRKIQFCKVKHIGSMMIVDLLASTQASRFERTH